MSSLFFESIIICICTKSTVMQNSEHCLLINALYWNSISNRTMTRDQPGQHLESRTTVFVAARKYIAFPMTMYCINKYIQIFIRDYFRYPYWSKLKLYTGSQFGTCTVYNNSSWMDTRSAEPSFLGSNCLSSKLLEFCVHSKIIIPK